MWASVSQRLQADLISGTQDDHVLRTIRVWQSQLESAQDRLVVWKNDRVDEISCHCDITTAKAFIYFSKEQKNIIFRSSYFDWHKTYDVWKGVLALKTETYAKYFNDIWLPANLWLFKSIQTSTIITSTPFCLTEALQVYEIITFLRESLEEKLELTD